MIKGTAALLGALGASALITLPVVAFRWPAATAPTETNLALGKPYSVSYGIPDTFFHNRNATWHDTGGVLTNGQYANPNIFYGGFNHQWVGYAYQDSRTITVDLGQIDTVHAITADYLNAPQYGVFLPLRVMFSVSNNGQDWQQVGNLPSPVPVSSSTTTSVQWKDSGLNIQARYVRIQFPVTVDVFTDEIQVFGQTGIGGGVPAPINTPRQTSPNLGYASLAQTHGVSDLLLTPLWLGANFNQQIYPWNLTPQQWLPLITYDSPSGKILNWYFPSVLAALGAGSNATSQVGWETWIQHLFTLGPYANRSGQSTELPALNQAVATGQAALHDPSHRVNVVIAIPYPAPSETNWGRLDGQTMDFASTRDRIKAVTWFIRAVEQAWQQANLTHLRLAGFYWTNESVYVRNPGEVQLVQATARLVHAVHGKFYWIPFYGAAGYNLWRKLGFDVAMLQPNYAFNGAITRQRFQGVAETAQHYGMGVEMEFPYAALNPASPLGSNRYLMYQDAALAYGYAKNVPLAWYQNTQSLLVDYQDQRILYNLVYDFLQGTYTPQAYVPDGSGQYVLKPVSEVFPAVQPVTIPRGINSLAGVTAPAQ